MEEITLLDKLAVDAGLLQSTIAGRLLHELSFLSRGWLAAGGTTCTTPPPPDTKPGNAVGDGGMEIDLKLFVCCAEVCALHGMCCKSTWGRRRGLGTPPIEAGGSGG